MPGWRKTPDDRRQDSRRYGADWRRKRFAALQAAQWRCQIRLPGCAGAATEVDHVDGAANDPHHRNLRAACGPCHAKVTAQQGGGYRAPRDPEPRPKTAWNLAGKPEHSGSRGKQPRKAAGSERKL